MSDLCQLVGGPLDRATPAQFLESVIPKCKAFDLDGEILLYKFQSTSMTDGKYVFVGKVFSDDQLRELLNAGKSDQEDIDDICALVKAECTRQLIEFKKEMIDRFQPETETNEGVAVP